MVFILVVPDLGDWQIDMMALAFVAHLVLDVIVVQISLLKIEILHSHLPTGVLTHVFVSEIRGFAISLYNLSRPACSTGSKTMRSVKDFRT